MEVTTEVPASFNAITGIMPETGPHSVFPTGHGASNQLHVLVQCIYLYYRCTYD